MFNKLHWNNSLNDSDRNELREKVPILYGEIEEVYTKIAGIRNVEVEGGRGQKAVYSTYLEAAILSPWTIWLSEGRQELFKGNRKGSTTFSRSNAPPNRTFSN